MKPHVIAIAMAKGGCCRTTTAINLAAALTRDGHKALIVDADGKDEIRTRCNPLVTHHGTATLCDAIHGRIAGDPGPTLVDCIDTAQYYDYIPSGDRYDIRNGLGATCKKAAAAGLSRADTLMIVPQLLQEARLDLEKKATSMSSSTPPTPSTIYGGPCSWPQIMFLCPSCQRNSPWLGLTTPSARS